MQPELVHDVAKFGAAVAKVRVRPIVHPIPARHPTKVPHLCGCVRVE